MNNSVLSVQCVTSSVGDSDFSAGAAGRRHPIVTASSRVEAAAIAVRLVITQSPNR
jgi:hypothetical protein